MKFIKKSKLILTTLKGDYIIDTQPEKAVQNKKVIDSRVEDKLRDWLILDLKKVLPKKDLYEDFDLIFKPYSKTRYGRYQIRKKRITIYIYSDPDRKNLFEYSKLLKVFIHEYVHHWQYSQLDYKRVKGVMHNDQFWEKYFEFMCIAKDLDLIQGEITK